MKLFIFFWFVLSIVSTIITAVLCVKRAKKLKRNKIIWGILGCYFSWFAVLILYLLSEKEKQKAKSKKYYYQDLIERNYKTGRITAIIMALITIITFIFFDSGVHSKSGNPESTMNWFCFFFYPITFIFLFFSYRKWIRIISLIAGIILIYSVIDVAIDYSNNILFFVVVCISSLTSYFIAIIFTRKYRPSTNYPPVSRPLSDEYIRSTEAYKQMSDMISDMYR